MMDVLKDDMEDGELDSSDGEDLGGYTPLQRPSNPKPHTQPPPPSQDYDSDDEPPCLPGGNSDSDSEDEEKNGRPAAKSSRPEGAWGRRGALVVEDGGGETFQRMAQAYQADRDARGLNKKKKNNVWGSVVQEESIAESIGSFGVGRQLKDLGSDRGAETYDFTLIAKERKEERRKQRMEEFNKKGEDLDNEMDSYWSKRGVEKEEELDNSSNDEEEKSKPDDAMMQEESGETTEKRGTKRSVKERLGAKKIQLDRFHNETLPAPGEPRQIVDIAEISLVEGSDQDFGEEVAERLKEDKEEMMVDLVKAVGRKVVLDFFKETQKVEREGGMVINNGARRRTPGGVMLHLLRKTERPELKEKLRKFFNDSQKADQRKILAAKKRKQKDFDKEMQDFLSARKRISEEKKEEDNDMEEDGVEEEKLAPLPNVLDMIANSMKGDKSTQLANKKATVTRVSSFKEPEAPPNSVERQERLSPVSKEERALLDYDDDDFLATSGDTEDIELF